MQTQAEKERGHLLVRRRKLALLRCNAQYLRIRSAPTSSSTLNYLGKWHCQYFLNRKFQRRRDRQQVDFQQEVRQGYLPGEE